MKNAVPALVALSLVLAASAEAASASSEDPQSAAAEELLARVEAAAGRPFDPGFRAQARRRLAALPAEEIRARLEHAEVNGLGERAAGAAATGKLAYTPVTPCRIVDTRVAGGSLAPGAPRDLRVTGPGLQGQGGETAGCNVPVGPAKAAVLNFVAVNPVGAGNLRAWAYSTPPVGPPTASVLNYALIPGSGLNLANAVVVPLCDAGVCPFDLRVQADSSGAHLVVDVVGYFSPHTTLLVEGPLGVATINLGPCASVQQLSMDVPASGKVLVQATAAFYIQHAQGTADDVYAHISTTPADCFPAGGGSAYRRWKHPDDPGEESIETGTFSRVFDVSAGSHTFHLNATVSASPNVDRILSYRLLATFYPE